MDIYRELGKPFPAKDIEWRVQRSGLKNDKPWALVLAYVTNRAIMERLDSVVGPANWKNRFLPAPNGGVLCGISIRTGSEWITKWDGADNTDIESVKGGLSGSMKRAGVQWNIGRYLYNLKATFAVISETGQHRDAIRDKVTKKVIMYFKWDEPALPSWALPGGEKDMSDPAQKLTDKTPSCENGEDKTVGGKTMEKGETLNDGKLPKLEGISYEKQGNVIIAKGKTFSVKGLLKNSGFKWNKSLNSWAMYLS